MPARLPRSIPLHVLRDRGDLTIHQALALYLVEDYGLTHTQAAEAMGLTHRAEIGMHLARARARLSS